jgi:hypothetical protein
MNRLLGLLAVLAAAFAMVPPGAQAAGAGQFSLACSYHHTLQDDPIVFPGQSGMSHSHDFAGAFNTGASSTNSTLLDGGTTCSRPLDHTGYWVPSLYQNGAIVHAREFRAYYRGTGFAANAVHPFPKGLRMIAGNSKVTDAGPYQPTAIASWACTINGGGAAGNEIEVESIPTDCGGLPLRVRIVFPQCWNGKDLDSADHKSHMAYAVRGKCPATHPVAVPELTLSLRYWLANTRGLALASGGTHSLHADFMLAWEGDAQEDLVRRCINAGVNCGAGDPAAGGSATTTPPPVPPAAAVATPPRTPQRAVMVRSRALALLCLMPAARSTRGRR